MNNDKEQELTYGDLEEHIATHLEQGTHIPKEDIEATVRMIMISVRQEVKYKSIPQTLPNVNWPKRTEDITGYGLTKEQIGWNKYHDALMKAVGEAQVKRSICSKHLPQDWDANCEACNTKIEAQPAGLVPLDEKEVRKALKKQVMKPVYAGTDWWVKFICSKFGNPNNQLLLLNEDKIYQVIVNSGYCKNDYDETISIAKDICSNYGTPALPSVDEIYNILYEQNGVAYMESSEDKVDRVRVEVMKNNLKGSATAIHDRLRGYGK